MKTLVTGGAGFIGRHVVEKFDGIVYDTADHKDHGIGNAQHMPRALRGIDQVIHLAAFTDALKSIQDPKRCWQANVDGFAHLLKCWNGPLFFASSAAVYEPLNPYALTKIVGESMIKDRPLTTIGRFYNVFGEGDQKSVIYKFIVAALTGEPLKIYGDGHQVRTFIYVKDLVGLIGFTGHLMGNTFIAGQKVIAIIELAQIIIRLTNSKSKIVFEPAKLGDPFQSICPNLINHYQYGFNLGLERTIQWVDEQLSKGSNKQTDHRLRPPAIR